MVATTVVAKIVVPNAREYALSGAGCHRRKAGSDPAISAIYVEIEKGKGILKASATQSVVIPRLKKFHAIVEHLVDQSIRLGYAARPHVPAHVFEVLRLSDPVVRIAHSRVHKVQHAESQLPVRVHPVSEIVTTLVLQHCIALVPCSHYPCPNDVPVYASNPS